VKRICLLFFAFFLLSISKVAFGAGEFTTNYNLRYQVNPDGVVYVNQDITLTNKLSAVYATKYSFTLPSTEIQNIKATDKTGPCQTEIKQNDKVTTIIITFNEPVVGTNKSLKFNLSYDSLDIARKNGEVWEINIPKIANESDVDNYSLFLAVPTSFDKPAFIRPEPIETLTEGDFTVYRFVKSQLAEAGINAAFGPFQIFDFTLFYHLKNPNLTTGETEIALPPDTAFQQLTYQKIDPQPLNITVDEDGNWLAKYRLKPHEKIKITATGKVKIFAQPLGVSPRGEPEKIFPPPSQENLVKNLKPARFWEKDNPEIIKIAQNLKTPREIYNLVVKTLNYDFSRVSQQAERMGAAQALANPNRAICMEFTDLFIALARTISLPAREIDGFAYTTDARLRPLSLMADVLHAWPEYYDEQRQAWIPVDPTWGKTTNGVDYFSKTDLNHFAFVIHGENSEYPYPAGSYKLEDSLGKDVQVGFGEYPQVLETKTPDLQVKFDLPKEILWGETKKGMITLKNNGQSAIYSLELKIQSQGVELLSSGNKQIKILPPLASVEIPLVLKTKNLLAKGEGFTLKVHPEGLIILTVNNQEYRQEIKVGSFLWQIIIPSGGFLLTLMTLLILLKKNF